MTTSINFHYRPSQGGGRRAGKLFIRIIHARQCRHITRNYSIYPDEWDAVLKRVVLPQYGLTTERCHYLRLIDESMKNDIKRLYDIVSLLGEEGKFSASDIAGRFMRSLNENTVFGYAEIAGNRLREQGRDRTARAYRSAARSLMKFKGGMDILLSEIDSTLIAAYEGYLLANGLKMNTLSFYLRNLRALYFRAAAERIIPLQTVNPFAGTHTGVYQTCHRALDEKQLKALSRLDEILSDKILGNPDGDREQTRKTAEQYDSLLYFMFCYHARGMSFVDMAHLRKTDIGDETIAYRRRKTGGMLELKVTEPMRTILSHFARRTRGSEYLFPIIDPSSGNVRRQYETGLKRQNRLLKRLARMAGIHENLSTHAARHTWATLAKRLNFPVAVIGEALGHRDVKTTSIYLASFDRSTMDELSVRLSETARAA